MYLCETHKNYKFRNPISGKMKNLFHLLFFAIFTAACTTSPRVPHYTITGKIAGADNVTFYLQKRVEGKIVKVDSAIVLKGEFKITGGAVEYPVMVSLVAKNKRAGLQFFLENTDILITGQIDSLNTENTKITGSKTQAEYRAYIDSLKPLSKKNKAINEEYQAANATGDKVKMAEIERKGDELYAKQTALTKEFVKSHPASYLSPTLLVSLSIELEAAEIESFINALDTNIAKVPLITDLKKRIAVMKTVAIGKKAPDFTMNDVNDKPVALSSKIGKTKLLLIDFWASWCGPCRGENPNVVKVYKEFNKKGFNVFSVSLDQKKEDWIKAIADDKLTWTHVSDLQYWGNSAAKLYAVGSIPANFLLDETGTIIAKNLRGEDLYKKVKEILTAKKK
jgi:peroxiredoxin